MEVKDIMITDIKRITDDMNAQQALDLLFKYQISGLPVVDKDNKLVGMFTEKEVITHILPSYVEKVGRFIYEDDPKSTKKKLQELSTVKVSQLMRKAVVTVTANIHLAEVARIMLTQHARRLPVIDVSGAVIGIVARCDVLKAMASQARS
jgi:CBS-domain-containing membrane protein